MKKSYIKPDMEVVLFQTSESVMDFEVSGDDPFDSGRSGFSLQQYLNDLPDGTILDEDGYEKR